jgi:hypothetical protein
LARSQPFRPDIHRLIWWKGLNPTKFFDNPVPRKPLRKIERGVHGSNERSSK